MQKKTNELIHYITKIISIFFQWDLVCNVSALSVLTRAIMFLGYMIGVLFGGVLSDKFGRKPIVYWLTVLTNVFALASAFIKIYWLYVLFRVLIGIGVGK